MEYKRLTIGALIICLVMVPLAVSAAEYSLSTGEEHDTPERDVDFEGDTYTISSISRVAEGDTLQTDATGPSDKLFSVNLYNPDNQIVDSEDIENGSGSASFDMSLTPGSYLLAVEQDGEFQKVHPVLIKAYDVSHSGPSNVEEDESFDVSADVTELSDEKNINYVQVVLANDNEDVTERATKTNGKYEATISTDDLGTGEYSLYATVRGNKDVRNRDELLGFSDRTTVTIESTSSSDGNDGAGGGGSGAGGGAGGGTGVVTPTDDGSEEVNDGNDTGIDADPDATTEATIEDSDPENPGVTVEFEGTTSAQRVTFDNEDTGGSIEVSEYDEPPASVSAEISNQYSGSSSDGEAGDGPTVVTVVDISPSESARESSATIELSVRPDALEDPATAVILHEQSDGMWKRLDTAVQEQDDGTVTLRTSVQSFSLFAVVDGTTETPTQTNTPSPTPTATSTNDSETATATVTSTPTASATATATAESVVTPQSTPTATATPTTGGSGPGFTIVGAVIALLAALSLLRQS